MEKKDLLALQSSVQALYEAERFQECIDLGFELLDQGKLANDVEATYFANQYLALASYYNGDIYQSFTYIVKYDEYSVKSNVNEYRLNALMMNYLLYAFLENYKGANEVIHQAIKLAETLEDHKAISECYTRLAFILNSQGAFLEACVKAEKSIQYANMIDPINYDYFCNAYIELIVSYIGQEQFDNAQYYIEDLITMGLENFTVRGQASALASMGKYYFATGDLDDSLNMYFKAKAYAETSNDLGLLKGILEALIEQCELQRNFILGYEMQREYIRTITALNKKELTAAAMQLETKKNYAEVVRKATMDPLTGTYNRSYLEQITNGWLHEEQNVCCLAFDLDHFKLINDQYGHLMGDEVLKALTHFCGELIPRDKAILARYGGDEFVIITKQLAMVEVKHLANELLEVIRQIKIPHEGETLQITASIGISSNSEQQFNTFEQLFKIADNHLYIAKREGRNRIYSIELLSK